MKLGPLKIRYGNPPLRSPLCEALCRMFGYIGFSSGKGVDATAITSDALTRHAEGCSPKELDDFLHFYARVHPELVAEKCRYSPASAADVVLYQLKSYSAILQPAAIEALLEKFIPE